MKLHSKKIIKELQNDKASNEIETHKKNTYLKKKDNKLLMN